MKIKTIILMIVLSSCYLSEELPPDQTVWEYDLPSNVQLNQTSLFDIKRRINSLEFEQIQGLIIIKNDRLVYEDYYISDTRFSLNGLSGASMALTVAAVGIAEEKGLFSLDDKIQDYLPEYSDLFEDDNNKTFISIRHLLLNKSGLSWSNTDLFNMQNENDWLRFVLDRPLQAPAGLQFNLNNATGIILAKIIEHQSGQSFHSFLEENILQLLEITNWSISQDALGNYDGAFGIRLSLLDFTKVGYLMLEEGIWDGRRVIDPNFVEEVLSIQTNVSASYNSGYFWRGFGEDLENVFGIDHTEFHFITGELGQHLYIIPSQNMVVAIDAENFFFGFGNPSLNLLAEISYMIQ